MDIKKSRPLLIGGGVAAALVVATLGLVLAQRSPEPVKSSEATDSSELSEVAVADSKPGEPPVAGTKLRAPAGNKAKAAAASQAAAVQPAPEIVELLPGSPERQAFIQKHYSVIINASHAQAEGAPVAAAPAHQRKTLVNSPVPPPKERPLPEAQQRLLQLFPELKDQVAETNAGIARERTRVAAEETRYDYQGDR